MIIKLPTWVNKQVINKKEKGLEEAPVGSASIISDACSEPVME